MELRLSLQLNAALQEEAQRAFVWRVSWTAINGAVVVASLVGVAVMPRSERLSLWVGAASAGVSAAFSWFSPLLVERNAELAERAAGSPGGTAQVRKLFAQAADDEQSRVEGFWHVLNLMVALIPATILWAHHDVSQGFVQLAGGLLLGEGALLTQPTRLSQRAAPSSELGFASWRLTW
jgi:hypothetical protein